MRGIHTLSYFFMIFEKANVFKKLFNGKQSQIQFHEIKQVLK